jgi:hypothetical protein
MTESTFMKAIFAVVVIGIVGLFLSTLSPSLEMWGPLIVSLVPLFIFLLWPVRDESAGHSSRKRAA